MGIFLVYILKASVCMALFYLFYRLLLSRETFHRFNRVALLSLLSLSLLLPLVQVTTTEQTEVHRTVLTVEQLLLMAGQSSEATDTQVEPATVSWIQVLLLVYLAGVGFFGCRHLYLLMRLMILIRSGRREKMEHGVRLIVHRKEIAPFSWVRYIVISEKDLEENGREILIHEMAHIRNRHSVDLLVADVCIFFQWFNPAAWLLKQELQNIHEYEADETVIKKGVDAKQYQLLLIKKAVGTRLYSMANSFNHSKLKKRITMMLKEKSSPWARLKYLYVLPLAAIAVTAFARPEVSDKVKEISAVKVNDLTAIVETKAQETVPKVVNDTVKTTGKVVKAVGWKKTSESSKVLEEKQAEGGGTGLPVMNLFKDKEGAPLIIVDGKEAGLAMMNALNPNRISSVSVLKDKSGTSIYGDKARNGVVIITLLTEEEFQQKMQKHQEMNYQFKVKTKFSEDGQKVVGKVMDKDGKPVAGAAVVIKGTVLGTIADEQGNFALQTPKDATLIISYINMKTSEVKASSSPISVTLKDE